MACAAVMRSAPAATSDDQNEIAKLYRGLSRYDPDTFREFLGPERSSGLALPAAVWRRLHPGGRPAFDLGPRIHAHIEDYIIKLTKALYYLHFNRIAPATAAIEFMMASNAELGEPRERQIDAMRFPVSRCWCAAQTLGRKRQSRISFNTPTSAARARRTRFSKSGFTKP